jgi:hypothetical protein
MAKNRLVLVVTFCDDLLRGDPSALIQRDKYDEFCRMKKLASDDYDSDLKPKPITIRYMEGDLTWIKDFWDAELKRGQP